MSTNVPVTKNEIRFFQNDMLGDVKKLENSLNNKFHQVNEVFNNQQLEYNIKLDKYSDNLKELLSVIVKRKLDNDKIEELLNMKNKIDEQLIENKTKIDMLSKNLSNATFKYDRMILDNLQVPGIIGVACKFKNCKGFFQNVFNELESIQQFKKQESLNSKELKNKIDNLTKKLEIISSELTEKCKQIYNNRIGEFQNLIEIRHKEMQTQMQVKVEEKTKELKENFEWENVKSQIFKNFDTEVEKFTKIIEDKTKNYDTLKENYNTLKKNLDDLTELIKNQKTDEYNEFNNKRKIYFNTSRSKKSVLEPSLKKNNSNKSNKTIGSKNEEKIEKNIENTFITSKNQEQKLSGIKKKQKFSAVSIRNKNNPEINNIKPIKQMSSSTILKNTKNNESKKNIVITNNDSELFKRTRNSKNNENIDYIDSTLSNREGSNKNIKYDFSNDNKTISLKANLDIDKIEKIIKTNSSVEENSLHRDSSSCSIEKDSPINIEKEILNFDDSDKNNKIKKPQTSSKLKLCSVDLMANETKIRTKLQQNILNLNNCLSNDIQNAKRKSSINYYLKENNEKKDLKNQTTIKKKSNFNTTAKNLYSKGIQSTIQVENINRKLFNNKNYDFPKSPISINKNNEKEKLFINCDYAIQNYASKPNIKVKDFPSKERINQNKLTVPNIKIKEKENYKNIILTMNDKKIIQKDEPQKIVAEINEKINSINNSNETMNVRIKSLEEKYKPLNNQINEILITMNQFSDYIKKSEINNIQSKTINVTKNLSPDCSSTNINIKNTYSKNKNNLKFNNNEQGIFLNFSRNKIKKDKEKETIRINSENKVKDKKNPHDEPNAVLRKVEPILIKLFKN